MLRIGVAPHLRARVRSGFRGRARVQDWAAVRGVAGGGGVACGRAITARARSGMLSIE